MELSLQLKGITFFRKSWKSLHVGNEGRGWHFSRQRNGMSPPGLKNAFVNPTDKMAVKLTIFNDT